MQRGRTGAAGLEWKSKMFSKEETLHPEVELPGNDAHQLDDTPHSDGSCAMKCLEIRSMTRWLENSPRSLQQNIWVGLKKNNRMKQSGNIWLLTHSLIRCKLNYQRTIIHWIHCSALYCLDLYLPDLFSLTLVPIVLHPKFWIVALKSVRKKCALCDKTQVNWTWHLRGVGENLEVRRSRRVYRKPFSHTSLVNTTRHRCEVKTIAGSRVPGSSALNWVKGKRFSARACVHIRKVDLAIKGRWRDAIHKTRVTAKSRWKQWLARDAHTWQSPL